MDDQTQSSGGLFDFCRALYEVVGSADSYASVFRDELFVNIFWLLLASSIATNLIYYYLINTILRMSWSKKLHWGGFMFLNFAIVAGISLAIGANLQNLVILGDGYLAHVINYSMINGCYSLVFFFLFSMIFKWKSGNAKHVPF